MIDIDKTEVEELKAARFNERRYQSALWRHPDCRDPEHPGCQNCMEEETNDDKNEADEP